MTREAVLTRTLVELADTLIEDFDVVDLLTRLANGCVEMLDVSAAGLMLAAPDRTLRVIASSSEEMRVVELFEIQSQEGPCFDCYATGEAAMDPSLATNTGHWPGFGPVALAAGFKAVHALPMRLRGETIGALNLFRGEEGLLDDPDLVAGQAMADVATIAILQQQAVRHTTMVIDQLNHALQTRIVIEQAKGKLAERAGLTMEEAFSRLRHHARSSNRLLVEVARSVVEGPATSELLAAPRP